MDKLFIKSEKLSPEICLSVDERKFYIKGISAPDNVRVFYNPVIEWIGTFKKNVNDYMDIFTVETPFIFEIDMSYFNSSSSKFLFDILTEIRKLKELGLPVVINWYYEDGDVDMKEAAKDLAALVCMQINAIEKAPEKEDEVEDFFKKYKS